MGFKYVSEALIFILTFGVLIGTPCFFIATWGGKMINEIGNFPTQAEALQLRTFWKVLIVEVIALVLMAMFFHFYV